MKKHSMKGQQIACARGTMLLRDWTLKSIRYKIVFGENCFSFQGSPILNDVSLRERSSFNA